MEIANLTIMCLATLVAYNLATWLLRASKVGSIAHSFFHPLVIGPILVAGFLMLTGIDYQQYQVANKPTTQVLSTPLASRLLAHLAISPQTRQCT